MCHGQLYSKKNTEPLQKSGSRFRGRKEGEFWWLVVLWVLHSCCESCLSRMKKRRQSDVILQEQGLLMTYVQLWVVWLFSWSLEVVWETVTFMLGVFLLLGLTNHVFPMTWGWEKKFCLSMLHLYRGNKEPWEDQSALETPQCCFGGCA